MKKFNDLTDLQKEYFYASGTVAALIAVGFLVPPMAIFAFAAAGFCLIAIAAVAITNRKPTAVKKDI